MYQQQQQQGSLPGAYYGPSIPPAQPYSYQHPHRGRNCFCCLLSTAVKFLIGFIVTLVVIAIVLWLALRPNTLKVYVESASLTQFDLNPNSTSSLRHSLTADISIRNPNKRVGVYYDWLEGSAYYDGDYWFQWTRLPTFYQGHKNTTNLRLVMQGQTFVDLKGSDLEYFNRQSSSGAFDIEVRLYGWVRYKVGSIKTRTNRLKVKCWLPGLRLAANGTTSGGFTRTKCKVDY